MSIELQQSLLASGGKGRSWLMRTFGPISPGSLRNSVYALTSIGIGASISHLGSLTFPKILQESGVLLGLAIIIGAGLVSLTAMNAVSKGVERTKEKTLTGVMGAALGKTAQKVCAWMIFFMLLAALCFYEVLSTI
jgi:hypothetical protein